MSGRGRARRGRGVGLGAEREGMAVTEGRERLRGQGEAGMMLHAWQLSVLNCRLRLKRQGWVSSGAGGDEDGKGLVVRRNNGAMELEGLDALLAERGAEDCYWHFHAADPFDAYLEQYTPRP